MGKQFISFDLWYTLIKSNPSFKEQRVNYFHLYHNFKQKPKDEIREIIREVDILCNALNEKTGGNIKTEEMYLMAIYRINESMEALHDIDINYLIKKMDELFFSHHPVLFDQHTKNVLDKLKKQGRLLGILSNTAFVKGAIIRQLLKEYLKISDYFSFQIYSDETLCSKPSKEIFMQLHNTLEILAKRKVSLDEIIHVGDNKVADIQGAKQFGIEAFQINTNQYSINNILH